MVTLSDVLALVSAGPYVVHDSYEKDGHYYFRLGLPVASPKRLVPFIFAIPVAELKTPEDADHLVKEHLGIVDAEHKMYLENGVPLNGLPTWA